MSPSLLSNCAEPPAARTTCAPLPGCSSRLCNCVPGGMNRIGHGVSRQNVRAFAGLHRHPHFEANRMQDVALLAVGIVQQRQTRRTVRIILDGRDARRNSLLLAPEIDRAVLLLVPAAAMPDRDFAVGVASARALLRLDQRLLRRLLGDLALIEHGHEAPRRCIWIKAFQCHNVLSSSGTPRRSPLPGA